MEVQSLELNQPLDTEYLRVMLEAGYLYLAMKKFKESQGVFEGVAALAPASEVPLVGLGNVFFVQHKFDDALKIYDKALKLVPDSAFALAYQGEAWFFKGDKAKALKALEQSSSLDATGKSGDFARSLIDLIGKGFDPNAKIKADK